MKGVIQFKDKDGNVTKETPRQRTEIWSRVMGYFRPITSWNIGKRGEWNERVSFKESKTNLK